MTEARLVEIIERDDVPGTKIYVFNEAQAAWCGWGSFLIWLETYACPEATKAARIAEFNAQFKTVDEWLEEHPPAEARVTGIGQLIRAENVRPVFRRGIFVLGTEPPDEPAGHGT